MTSVEQKLLSCATLLKPDARHLAQMQRLLPKIKDTDAFISLAMHEGLTGLLYKALLKSGLFKDLEDSQKQKLQAHYYQIVRLNLLRIHELKRILQQIARTDIQVVLLKGIALIHDLYRDVGLRPMDDIDIWVMARDFKKFSDILIRIGYKPDPLYPSTFRNDLITLDVKTHILGADRIHSRRLLLSGSQEEIYRKTRFITIDEEAARCLGRYDQVLYLGLHLLKHNAERLIWLADIQNLVADWKISDWRLLVTRAQKLGQEKCTTQTFFLMGRFFEWCMPAEIRAKLAPLNPIEKKILRLHEKKGALPEWSTLILFSSGKGPLIKIRFILETLFPRPEILRQVFAETPELGAFRLYARRFLQLIQMARHARG